MNNSKLRCLFTCIIATIYLVSIPLQSQAVTPKGYVSQGGLTWMPISFDMPWSDANAYCTNTAINGQTGWRLPTKDELSALYNSGAMKDQGGTLYYTWSSTPNGRGLHYDVGLNDGYVGPGLGTTYYYVTCVRGIPESVQTKQNQPVIAPKANFISQGGLTWMPINDSMKNWTDANAYCTNTAINGKTGWRLPTKGELTTLYDSGEVRDQGWSLNLTWSSTPASSGHYAVTLLNGLVLAGYDMYPGNVTCVH